MAVIKNRRFGKVSDFPRLSASQWMDEFIRLNGRSEGSIEGGVEIESSGSTRKTKRPVERPGLLEDPRIR